MVANALRTLLRPRRPADLAVDLGTAYLRVARSGDSAFGEWRSALPPSLPDSDDRDARWYPAMRHGVIADIGAAAEILSRAIGGGRSSPRVLLCIPSDASSVERSALYRAAKAAGAGEVAIVPEPQASAIGAGIDTSSVHAQLLVDIGDGVTDMAVFRCGEMVGQAALRVACGDLREALVDFVRASRAIELDPARADVAVRSAYAGPADGADTLIRVTGRRADTADPVVLSLSAGEVIDAVADIEARIVDFVFETFLALPDETAAEVIESGLCLTGGGALMPRLVGAIRSRTGLDVRIPADPLHAIIAGARAMLPEATRSGLWQA